jgi:hypothetical protein
MAKQKPDKQASKSAAAKKVARAAQSGGGASDSRRRFFSFATLITLIIVAGVIGVVAAWNSRSDAVRPTQNNDHWHAAYSVWDCAAGDGGEFLEPFQSTDDPLGIHSHQDGLMHIHPFFEESAGNNAQTGVFFDAMGVEITDAAIVTAGTTLEAGVECDGEVAIIQIAKWPLASVVDESPTIYTSTDEMNGINYKNDAEAYTILRAPEGADIPPPETIPNLITVTDAITPEDLDLDGDGEIDEQFLDSTSGSDSDGTDTSDTSEGTDSTDDGS